MRRKKEGCREIGREKGRCRKDVRVKNHNYVVIDTLDFCSAK